MRRLIVILMLLLPVPALAQDRPQGQLQGLLWNRSGLPLTLPLQIRSDPGTDLVVFLSRPDDPAPVIAGYVRGGAFFRLLVPPGDYRLDFAAGRDWQGDAALFGPETRRFGLPGTLHFGVEGTARRAGHMIDLRGSGVAVGDFALCRGDAPGPARSATRATPRAEAAPPPDPVPVPRDLAAPRRAETRLPPPDQPPARPEGDPPAFAALFPEPPRAAIPRVQPPAAEPVRPASRIAVPVVRRNVRWRPCD